MLKDMKKHLLLGLAFVFVVACQKENSPSLNDEFVKATITVGTPDSKTNIASDGKVTWDLSDTISLFTDTDNTDGSSNYLFSVSALGTGSKSASFNGVVADNSSRTKIYAVYPYSASYDGEDPTALPIAVPSKQIAGNEALYAIMKGSGTVNGNDFSPASVTMSNLCWIYDVTIDNSVGKSISAVYFEAESSVFTTAGTIDITAAGTAVSASATSKSVRVEYATAQTSSSINARFVLLPISCPATDFNIDVVFDDESYERFSFAGKSLNTAAGDRFVNSITVGGGEMGALAKGYRLVSAGANIATEIANAVSAGDEVVKLWLESSPSESKTFNTTSRINPSKSIYIKSDPLNMKPTITIGAAAAISPRTGCDIETLHFENIIFRQSDSGAGDFIYIDTNQSGGADNVQIGNVVIENCDFTNFKYSLIRTSSLSGGMKIDRILFNNSIWTGKSSFDATRAWLHFVNNADKMREIKITNSTIIVTGCLMYNNMNNASGVNIDYTIKNCTFGNTKNTSTSNNYFISIVSGTLKGDVNISKNLFAGTHTLNTNDAKYILLREGSTTNYNNTIEDNYYTAGWRGAWKIDLTSKNYLFDILTNQTATDNDSLVPGHTSNDFTVTAGSDVYTNGIGDPGWIN